MVEVRQTETFREWFANLRDLQAKRRIAQRIVRLQSGLFGDSKGVGDGVRELRIDYGPGYRIYFVQRGAAIIILICGGDKRSQGSDIARAKLLALDL